MTRMVALALALQLFVSVSARADMLIWDNYPGDVLQDVTFNMSSERNTQIVEPTWVTDDVDLLQAPGSPDPATLELTRLEWIGAYNQHFTYSRADVILLDTNLDTVLELPSLEYAVQEVYDDPNSPYYNPGSNATTYKAEIAFEQPIVLADLVGDPEELEHFYIGVRLVGSGFYEGRNYFVTSSIDTTLRGRTQGYAKAVTFGAPDWRPASDVWYGTPDGTRSENFEFAFRLYAVPEPASIALLALGGLTLLAWRRRHGIDRSTA